MCDLQISCYKCTYFGVDEVVDGAAFLDLTEEDVKTLIKPIGYVKRLVRLIKSKSEVSCPHKVQFDNALVLELIHL